MASLWHVIFLHLRRTPDNKSRGLGLLGALSEQPRSCRAALSSSLMRLQPWEEPQNLLCCVRKSQGLIFVSSSLPSKGVEWKNEAELKQIAASGDTCGLHLNRAINQQTDMSEGGREKARETSKTKK